MIAQFKHVFVQRSTPLETSVDVAPIEALVGPLPPLVTQFLQLAHGGLIYYDLTFFRGKKRQGIPFHMIHELGADRSRRNLTTVAGFTKAAHDAGLASSIMEFGFHPFRANLYFDVPPQGSGRVLVSGNDHRKLAVVAESFDAYIQGLQLNYERIRERLELVVQGGDPRGRRDLHEWLEAAVPDWRTRYRVPDEVLRENPA